MSDNDLQSKIEFVEKMKRENPRAFEFLAQGADNLMKGFEDDLLSEVSDWYNRSVRIIGKQKTKQIIQALLKLIEGKKE